MRCVRSKVVRTKCAVSAGNMCYQVFDNSPPQDRGKPVESRSTDIARAGGWLRSALLACVTRLNVAHVREREVESSREEYKDLRSTFVGVHRCG